MKMGSKAHKVIKVRRASRVPGVQRARLDRPAHKVSRAHRVFKVPGAIQVHRVNRVRQVPKGHKDLKEMPARRTFNPRRPVIPRLPERSRPPRHHPKLRVPVTRRSRWEQLSRYRAEKRPIDGR